MNPLTVEWVEKADGDYATAQRELRARKQPNFDAACFHAQQCAEKYLKAILHEHGVVVPKSHNLISLLELCLAVDSTFEPWRNSLVLLDHYSVRFRYPGESAKRAEARRAVDTVTPLRLFVRSRLDLV